MRNFFKKWYFIVPLCAIFTLCSVFCLAPSASAAGADGISERYAVLPFDDIYSIDTATDTTTFITEWCYNVGMVDTPYVGWRYSIYSNDLESSSPVLTGLVGYSNSRITGSFRIVESSNFALETAFLVFEMDRNNDAILSWNEDPIGEAKIEISFDVVDFALVQDNSRWETTATHCSYTFYPNGYACNLYTTIYDMLIYNGFDDDRFYGITNLQVLFYGSTVTSAITYEVDTSGIQANRDFYNWFDEQALAFESAEDLSAFALGEWLGDTVQAFMDFEIYPGLSLNRVFAVVLVVGIFALVLTIVI